MRSLSGVRVASGSRYCVTSSAPVGYWSGAGEFQPTAASRRSAALSMLYSQGENMRTWPHWRTACPACGPGFEHDRFHAALQHVGGGGEADRARAQDGDGLASVQRVGHGVTPVLPRIIEIMRQKNSRDLAQFRQARRRAGAFGAAFLDHVIDQAAHQLVVGVAEQRGALARLGHQADADQRLQMVREGRGSEVEPAPAAGRPACLRRLPAPGCDRSSGASDCPGLPVGQRRRRAS